MIKHAHLIEQFKAEFKTNGEAYKNWQSSHDDGVTWKDCTASPAWNPSYLYRRKPTGHPHAELMKLYAEDAANHERPWELWESQDTLLGEAKFGQMTHPISWLPHISYRRKPVSTVEPVTYMGFLVFKIIPHDPLVPADALIRQATDTLITEMPKKYYGTRIEIVTAVCPDLKVK
jgi:hypothetical protein